MTAETGLNIDAFTPPESTKNAAGAISLRLAHIPEIHIMSAGHLDTRRKSPSITSANGRLDVKGVKLKKSFLLDPRNERKKGGPSRPFILHSQRNTAVFWFFGLTLLFLNLAPSTSACLRPPSEQVRPTPLINGFGRFVRRHFPASLHGNDSGGDRERRYSFALPRRSLPGYMPYNQPCKSDHCPMPPPGLRVDENPRLFDSDNSENQAAQEEVSSTEVTTFTRTLNLTSGTVTGTFTVPVSVASVESDLRPDVTLPPRVSLDPPLFTDSSFIEILSSILDAPSTDPATPSATSGLVQRDESFDHVGARRGIERTKAVNTGESATSATSPRSTSLASKPGTHCLVLGIVLVLLWLGFS